MILIVDDQRAAARALQRLLRSAGRDVDMVSSGEEALADLKQRKPDLGLLDIMMPGLSGLDVLRIAREAPELSQIPMLLYTAATSPAFTIVYAFASGLPNAFVHFRARYVQQYRSQRTQTKPARSVPPPWICRDEGRDSAPAPAFVAVACSQKFVPHFVPQKLKNIANMGNIGSIRRGCNLRVCC